MRIAIIAPPWVAVPPAGYGGTETVLDTLTRGLAGAGHDVLLFTTGDSTCPVRRHWVFDAAVGVGVGGPAAELRHVIAAYEAAADFDVVHDHTLVGPLYADRYPWLAVVTTNHGPFQSDLACLYRAVSDRVPVIAISHRQAAAATDVNLAGVVHHGVDVERFPVGSGRGGYALFLGRMHPDKGVHVAARVARAAGVPLKIAAKMSEIRELRYFEQQVAPHLGGGVEFVGEVGGPDKLSLLADAICLLNPIGWPEPFGMVMIEALACGTPVIATRAGAAPEIVDHGLTGYLAELEADMITAVRQAPDLDRAACRQSAADRFSARRMVDQHLAVYQTVADDHRRGRFVAAGPARRARPREAAPGPAGRPGGTMGLSFEISGHPSTIVVTLSGATDLAALRPLQAALAAALADGQTVVVNLNDVAHLDAEVLAELLAQTQPMTGQLRLVAATADVLVAIAALGRDPRVEIYPSVAAALADRGFGPDAPAGQVDGQGGDLPAKFAHLSAGYRTAIEQCRHLLHRLEDATDNMSGRSGPLDRDGAFQRCASERPGERKPA